MANFVFISPYDQVALGVRYLSSTLKAAGHKVRILFLKDAYANRSAENLRVRSGYLGETASCSDREYEIVRDLMREFRAEFVGLSFSSQSFGLSAWLSANFRRDFPGLPIIWGGVDPAVHPELGIEHCDFLGIGESEDSLLELVETISAGKDPSGVQGFWMRKGAQVIRNPLRPLIQDLDRLPFPDYEPGEKFLIQDDQYRPLHEAFNYIIMTQRGCPHKCTFCANSPLRDLHPGERYVRRRSVQNVIAELRQIRRIYPDLNFIQIYDDVFTINKKWLQEFAEQYKREIALPFWCYTYPGQCDEETAALLRDAGVIFMHMGLQSASERVLKDTYSRPPAAKIVETATILHRHGVPIAYDILAGNPLETDEDHLATLELLLALPRPFRLVPIMPLCLFFNLPITRLAKEQGVPLRQPEGVNGYLPAGETHFRFWCAIFNLTQYPILDKEFICRLARDPEMKFHADILEEFEKALLNSYWVWPEPGHFTSAREEAALAKKDLQQVTAERDHLRARLAAIEGKRSYRVYKKLKEILAGQA